jgi:hypothetical protein
MTERNQLARTVRNLAAITGLEELWQQRTSDGETDQDYWAFIDWLDAGSNRGAVPGKHLEIAARWGWAERAIAYERANDLQAGLVPGSKKAYEIICDNLTRMLQIETTKLMKQSAVDPNQVVSVKDLLSTATLLREIQTKAIQEKSQATDLSKFTPDEIRHIMKSQAIMRAKAGSK